MYERMGAEDVFVAAGAEEAVFLFFTAVLRRGQAVVVHYPAYQSLFQVRTHTHNTTCMRTMQCIVL
jgi:aspartate/methionine/tyrosine aminotransferase